MVHINTIYNEDANITMSRMLDCFVDLTVTSPPYGELRNYNGYSFDFESIANQLYRITKIGGVVVWIVGDVTINGSETGTSFKQALYFKNIGFRLHDTMIYSKKTKPLTHNRYEQSFEYMFVFVKEKLKTFNPIYIDKLSVKNKQFETYGREKDGSFRRNKVSQNPLKLKGNIWQYNVGKDQSTKDKEAHEHPAIFPEQLVEDHILSWSNEGDLIYDCFMGSGTTAKMATLNNRNFLGSEISKKYCEVANKRIGRYKMF